MCTRPQPSFWQWELSVFSVHTGFSWACVLCARNGGRCQGRKADRRHLCAGLMSRRTEHELWSSVQELFRSVFRVHRGLLGPFARKVRKDLMILLS